MPGKVYRVRIARGDEQFEAEGDKSFVLDMLRRFQSGGGSSALTKVSVGKDATAATAAKLASSKSIAVGEFIRQFAFKKHTDRVLAFGYYLEQHSGMESFTPADINNLYYQAKLEPSNTSQAIAQNIRRGFIMEAKKGTGKVKGGSKYTLTSTGEAHLKKVAAKSTEAD
jgi:hypothetical protein